MFFVNFKNEWNVNVVESISKNIIFQSFFIISDNSEIFVLMKSCTFLKYYFFEKTFFWSNKSSVLSSETAVFQKFLDFLTLKGDKVLEGLEAITHGKVLEKGAE